MRDCNIVGMSLVGADLVPARVWAPTSGAPTVERIY